MLKESKYTIGVKINPMLRAIKKDNWPSATEYQWELVGDCGFCREHNCHICTSCPLLRRGWECHSQGWYKNICKKLRSKNSNVYNDIFDVKMCLMNL